MNSTFINLAKKSLLLLSIGLLSVSCLNNANEDQNSSDQLYLTLTLLNANSPVETQSDTLNISRIRLLVGAVSLKNNSGDSLLVREQAAQLSHTPGNSENKGITAGSFNSDALFNILAFQIKQAESSDMTSGSNIDKDAFIEGDSEDQRYSLIIDGTYNGADFTFKSARSFNYELTIQDNTGGDTGSIYYNLNLKTDVSSWFINPQNGGLLDPREADNASMINMNIKNSATL